MFSCIFCVRLPNKLVLEHVSSSCLHFDYGFGYGSADCVLNRLLEVQRKLDPIQKEFKDFNERCMKVREREQERLTTIEAVKENESFPISFTHWNVSLFKKRKKMKSRKNRLDQRSTTTLFRNYQIVSAIEFWLEGVDLSWGHLRKREGKPIKEAKEKEGKRNCWCRQSQKATMREEEEPTDELVVGEAR